MLEIVCPHIREHEYTYKLSDKIELDLCSACNMNLASEILRQLALEVFCKNVLEDKK